jgi:hypothetical protein
MDNCAITPDLVDYSRQAAFYSAREIPGGSKHLIIVGCGGIGFWAGINAAMSGCFEKITLIDKDKVEPSNLNRLPVPQGWIGKSKAAALGHVIHTIRPALIVVPLYMHIDEDTMPVLTDLIKEKNKHYYSDRNFLLDTTDNAVTQNMLYTAWKKLSEDTRQHYSYCKAGYEGLKVGLYGSIKTWVAPDYRPGYRTAESNTFSSSIAGALAILRLINETSNAYNEDNSSPKQFVYKDVEINLDTIVKGEVADEKKKKARTARV